MNETEALRHVLDTLCKRYDYVDSRTSLLDQNDPKFAQLTNAQNRIARSILATISLMRDPAREIMFDKAAEAKQDVAKLAKEILEAEGRKGGEKKSLLTTYRDADGKIRRGSSRVRKTIAMEEKGASSRKSTRLLKNRSPR